MSEPYQQIINSLASGVIAVDETGVVVTANAAAARHLYVEHETLAPGVVIADVPAMAPITEVFREVRESGEPVERREMQLALPDGARKIVGMSASLLEGPNTFNGVIFLFVDMTERREQERLAELNRQLASLGELTAGVVHELRNPVSVISGMAELLLRRIEPEDSQRSTVEAISKEAAHLERSIAQFLGFARPFELKHERHDPAAVIERAVELCRRHAQGRSVELATEVPERLPLLHADRERLAQALANVVNNAIDAAPQGTGRVTLRVDEMEDVVRFRVEDNGPGIHLQPGEDLFTPFFTKKEGGTGLGLTIVHRIVTAHRGHLHYENLPEQGARFTMAVPIQALAPPELPDGEF